MPSKQNPFDLADAINRPDDLYLEDDQPLILDEETKAFVREFQEALNELAESGEVLEPKRQ